MTDSEESGGDSTVEKYSSDAAVRSYAERAVEGDLVGAESRVFETYFTPREGRVLDVGCGAGRATRLLDDFGFDVVGVDPSASMVSAARDLHPDIDFRTGTAADLDFDDETFDYVLFSSNGLDYLHSERERRRALDEVYRVLVPGGLFAHSSHNWLYNLPALLGDPGHLVALYVADGNLRRLFDRYKVDSREYGVETYLSNPLRQRRQLREAGFELLERVGKRDGLLGLFERSPYYVARRPRQRDARGGAEPQD